MFGRIVELLARACIPVLALSTSAAAQLEISEVPNFLPKGPQTISEIVAPSARLAFDPEEDGVSPVEEFWYSQDFWLRFRADCAHKRMGYTLPDKILILEGEIGKGDLDRLIPIVERNSYISDCAPPLVINSLGGDFDEAMRIADYVATEEIPVAVAPSGFCVSSCVYILLASIVEEDGGIQRRSVVFNNSIVAVHEPFLSLTAPETARATLLTAAANPSDFFDRVGARWQALFNFLVRIDATDIMISALLTPEGQSPTKAYVLSQTELQFLGIDSIPLISQTVSERLEDTLRQVCLSSMATPEFRFDRFSREGFFQNYYVLASTFFDVACLVKVEPERFQVLIHRESSQEDTSELLAEETAIRWFSAFNETSKHNISEDGERCIYAFFEARNVAASFVNSLSEAFDQELKSAIVDALLNNAFPEPLTRSDPGQNTMKIMHDLELRGLTALEEISLPRLQGDLFDRYSSMAGGNFPFSQLWSSFPNEIEYQSLPTSCASDEYCWDHKLSQRLLEDTNDPLYSFTDYDTENDLEIEGYDSFSRVLDVFATIAYAEALFHTHRLQCGADISDYQTINIETDLYLYMSPTIFHQECPNGRGYCSPLKAEVVNGNLVLSQRSF